jgi:hypothetical protein
MSSFLKAVGTVAGIAAMFPGPHQPIAAAVAVTANIGAQITARPPVAQGASTSVTIGADMPSPYILGETYYGGNRVYQMGYGEEDDVPNAHAGIVDIYGVAGPYEFVGAYADFTPLTFTGTNADGFYHDYMHFSYQAGETPESSALAFHWAGQPDWGAGHKLSGNAAGAWSLRRDRKGKYYASGVPQFGAKWKTPAAYDPREDDTYPGGEGDQRWADPADVEAHSDAKGTWTATTRCPGLQALRYALGSWIRDETDSEAPYVLRFGMGLPWDSIIVSDFVAIANACDANGWNCDGVIFEPGGDGLKWENLKNILAAGGAEPCVKGGRLGARFQSPKVPLDTIELEDIAGEVSIAACMPRRERINTMVPEYRSPDHRWEFVAAAAVTHAGSLAEDGEERRDTLRWNLVESPDQVTELAMYRVLDGREEGPIELPAMPRLRNYRAGEVLALSDAVKAEFGVSNDEWEIRRRGFDPETMLPRLTLVSRSEDKDSESLGLTGTPPPDITIIPPEDLDTVVGEEDEEIDGGDATTEIED